MADNQTTTSELIAHTMGDVVMRLRAALCQIRDRPMPHQHAAHLELDHLKRIAREALQNV